MTLLTFLMMIYLTSCASSVGRGISEGRYDALANESLLRYTDERKKPILKNEKSSLHEILSCHGNNFSAGLEALKNRFNSNKKDPEYWNHVGTCYYLQKDYLKAQFFYKLSTDAAKNENKEYPPAFNNLGITAVRLGHFQEAFEYLKTAKEMSPSLLTVTFNLSQLYLQFHLYDKAIALLEDLHRKTSEDIDVLASLGTGYLFQGNNKKTISYFEKIDPNYLKRIDIATTFALALYLENDFKRAQVLLKNRDNTPFEEYKGPAKKLNKLVEAKLEEIRRKEEELKRQEEEKKKANKAETANKTT